MARSPLTPAPEGWSPSKLPSLTEVPPESADFYWHELAAAAHKVISEQEGEEPRRMGASAPGSFPAGRRNIACPRSFSRALPQKCWRSDAASAPDALRGRDDSSGRSLR